MLGPPPPPISKAASRGRDLKGTHRAFILFMVIAIIVTSWIGFSTILCLAFARVAARPRPLVGDNVPLVGENASAVGNNVSAVGDNGSLVGGNGSLVGDNVTAEVETPGRQTRNPEFKAVCATS